MSKTIHGILLLCQKMLRNPRNSSEESPDRRDPPRRGARPACRSASQTSAAARRCPPRPFPHPGRGRPGSTSCFGRRLAGGGSRNRSRDPSSTTQTSPSNDFNRTEACSYCACDGSTQARTSPSVVRKGSALGERGSSIRSSTKEAWQAGDKLLRVLNPSSITVASIQEAIAQAQACGSHRILTAVDHLAASPKQ